jgi:hypothetical protein
MCATIFGNDEEDIRDIFCNSRIIQGVACITLILFIVLVYITVDCHMFNSARQCNGVTILTSIACAVCIVCVSVLLRWKYCWNKPTALDTVVDTTLTYQSNPINTSPKLSKSSKRSSRKDSISSKTSKTSKTSKNSNESNDDAFAIKNPMESI